MNSDDFDLGSDGDCATPCPALTPFSSDAATFRQHNSGRLTMGVWNINSLRGKMDDMHVLFDDLKPDIFGLCETKLVPGLRRHQFDIPGYRFLRRDRPNSVGPGGGGLGLYVSEQVTVIRKRCIELQSLEALVADIRLKNCSFAVIICYKPPASNVSDFFASLSTVTESALRMRSEVIIMGDLNCNILGDCARLGPGRQLFDFCVSYGLSNVITDVTRPRSGTLLDVILTTHRQRCATAVVIPTGASDHSICCACLSTKAPRVPPRKISYRCSKHTYCPEE
ncbi:MAG: hypothetical protein GY696_15175 [Gammaproteobacteria bacterium]|nr:hypothetical protein [Gammaproteobacteria bacterium]